MLGDHVHHTRKKSRTVNRLYGVIAKSTDGAVRGRILVTLMATTNIFAFLGLFLLGIARTAVQAPPPQYELTLVNREGQRTPVGLMPASTFATRISPNGREIVFDTSADGTIWIAPLSDITARRRITAEGRNRGPMWSGDGRRILYINDHEGAETLFWKSADGTGVAEIVTKPARAPESWSSAQQQISFITFNERDYDVWTYSLTAKRPFPFAAVRGSPQHSSYFSPDGRWIAYASEESGRREIYVQAFPGPGPRIQVTKNGGGHPLWAPDQKELFFDNAGQMFVVPISTDANLKAGDPRPLPITGFLQGPLRRQYDLMPDGKQFLMLFPRSAASALGQSFEVASIRPNKSNERTRVNAVPASGRLVISNMTVKEVIQGAYGIQSFELMNADNPVLNQRIDIEAKTERPVNSGAELQRMLQPLLAERFKLAVHREMREMNAMVLVLARKDGQLGPKMKKTESACDALGTAVTRFVVTNPTASPDKPACGFGPGGIGRIGGIGLDIPTIIGLLAPSQGRPIVDQTGLQGRYDIDVTYTPEPFSAAALGQRGATPPPGVDPNGPSLFNALEDQLGLKLEARRLPVPVLVIDRIEPLKEN